MGFYLAKAIIKHTMNILNHKIQIIIDMRSNSIIYSISYFWIKNMLFILIKFYLKLWRVEGDILVLCGLSLWIHGEVQHVLFHGFFCSLWISFSFSSLIFFWMSTRGFWCSAESYSKANLAMFSVITSLGLGILPAMVANWFLPIPSGVAKNYVGANLGSTHRRTRTCGTKRSSLQHLMHRPVRLVSLGQADEGPTNTSPERHIEAGSHMVVLEWQVT